MRLVRRDDIVDYQTYGDQREEFRRRVMAVKEPRRIHVGDDFTLLVENTLTIRYQIQEMMRAERIVREDDIQHELDTYNALLGGDGELGCTLLIEIPDAQDRARKLSEWLGLPERVYLELEDGVRVFATVDADQQDGSRVSSVQYLRYRVDDRVPVAAGVDFPGVEVRTALTAAQRSALREDLGA